MNKYVTELNFPYSLLRPDVDPYSFPKKRHIRLNLDIINPDMIGFFNKLNLEIILVEVFYSRPFFQSGIHIDSMGGDINKINWIYGGKDCQMNWYSVKENSIKKSLENTVIGTSYQSFDRKDVNLEFAKVLRSPSLVCVGAPHNVHNQQEHRWCISLVYQYQDLKQRLTMKESLEIFKEFI
jgi:hypothetical protein